ncbi:hypothetical protein [Streptomyces sp. NPDC059874]|uniref:hypothetical protein n=1 Tax=Streptomyces sp. NPDC059874 TaxID=3346983 RepID=UPI003665EFB1
MGNAGRRGAGSALAAVACAALLVGCTQETRVTATPGPTATTTTAPPEALALAERYRTAGGDADVYGIQMQTGPQGAPLLTVRTRSADSDGALFDRQSASIVGYLTSKEGLSLGKGYLIDVFGPDGALLHRQDSRR